MSRALARELVVAGLNSCRSIVAAVQPSLRPAALLKELIIIDCFQKTFAIPLSFSLALAFWSSVARLGFQQFVFHKKRLWCSTFSNLAILFIRSPCLPLTNDARGKNSSEKVKRNFLEKFIFLSQNWSELHISVSHEISDRFYEIGNDKACSTSSNSPKTIFSSLLFSQSKMPYWDFYFRLT